MVCRLIAMAQAAATLSDEIRNYRGEVSLGVGPEGSGRNDVGGDRVQSDLQQHVGEGVGGDGSVTSQAGSEGLPHVGDGEQMSLGGNMPAILVRRGQSVAALVLMAVDSRDDRVQGELRKWKVEHPNFTFEQYEKASVAFEDAGSLSKYLVIILGAVGQAIAPVSAEAEPWGLACMQHGMCDHVSEGCFGSVAGARVHMKATVWRNVGIRQYLDMSNPSSTVRFLFDHGLYPSVHKNMFSRVGKFVDRMYSYLSGISFPESGMPAWCNEQQKHLSVMLRAYSVAEAGARQVDLIRLHREQNPNCPITHRFQFTVRQAGELERMALAVDAEKWRGVLGVEAAAAAEPAGAIIAPAGPAVAAAAASASAMDVDVAVPWLRDNSGVPALGAAAGHLPSSSGGVVEKPSVFSRLELRPSGIPPPRPPPGDPPVINQTPPELIRPFGPRHKELFVASTFEQRQAWISVQCAMPHLGHKLVAIGVPDPASPSFKIRCIQVPWYGSPSILSWQEMEAFGNAYLGNFIPQFEALYKDGIEGLKLRPYGYGQHN